MEEFNIFADIAQRTGGDIYIGVVGPVRTGKSTFVRKFVERLILPQIEDEFLRTRMLDELPQSGAGRTVMTVEPKFVPEDAFELTPREGISLRVRLVDCVGYPVSGALGFADEAGEPRMVLTPWFDHEVSFTEAAEIGTRKVVAEHATVAVVITSDGTIADIARSSYLEAEQRVVSELRELGKPFVVILNTVRPYAQETLELLTELETAYAAPIIPVDAANLSEADVHLLLEQLLFEFPVQELTVALPRWVEELERSHWLREKFTAAAAEAVQGVRKVRDVDPVVERLGALEFVAQATLASMDMGSGRVRVELEAQEDLYYQVLEEITGIKLDGRHTMVRLLREWAYAKAEYDKVATALQEVRTTGYGMVPPQLTDMTFEEPELTRRGATYGIRLKANAPSLHFIRADISTEVTPIIGTEKQGEELVQYLMERFQDDPKKLWDFDIFGKSLYELVREGIQNKLYRMPDDAQTKLQETLSRIINEGSGGLICIII